ncbi:MAG: 2-oxoacid:acceptor oxidoreductase family protein [Clostridia bacterium]|nr:2-oxoacid:acceptor oxidoreductase family protein [Clostridia bacterium]
MEGITEIRWHARGGQGAVTAAKLLAEMALAKDLYFQAFPEYGPERMGAPIQCFNRLSAAPISLYTGVDEPDLVIVVDPTLLGTVDVARGLREDGRLLVNTPASPASLRATLGLQGRQIYTVDATRISLETIGRAMPNTPMLGAALRVLGLIPLEVAVGYLRESFTPKFGAKVTEGNVAAMERAYAEVQQE